MIQNSFNATISNCSTNVLDEYLVKCHGWRQTGGCNFDGPREPNLDQSCNSTIEDGWSGYCECRYGQKMMKKNCEKGEYSTCDEACGNSTEGKND